MDCSREFIDGINDNPLYRTIGIAMEEAGGGTAKSTLRPNPDVCWPFPGQPHGGMLFTLLDTTMAWAVVSELDEGLNCTTISLEIQYLQPARGARFSCSARTIHRTGRMSFVRAEIEDEEGRMVASAQATFRIIPYAMK